MHRDTVIGIVGVVILVAAMVGVFTYERGVAANLLPAGGFTAAELAGPGLDGTTPAGGETAEVLSIAQTNMTKISFTLTWANAQTSENTLQLVVAPASGTGLSEGVESEPESDGEITVELLVPNDEPTSGPLALGVGDYEVTVRFVGATPPGPLSPAPLPVTDSEVSWALATSLTAYEPADAGQAGEA